MAVLTAIAAAYVVGHAVYFFAWAIWLYLIQLREK